MRTTAMLVEWRASVFAAESDPDRYLNSARARHRQWETDYALADSVTPLRAAAAEMARVTQIDQVAVVCESIAKTPLPVVFSVDESLRIPSGSAEPSEEPAKPPELAVAFLSFLIDRRPANEIDFLNPGVVHDLELQVRVSRWPESAVTLQLRPVTIELPSTYDLPIFEFQRPRGDPPYILHRRDRALLKFAQGIAAHPFEFKYAAAFKPDHVEQPVAVVGQRTLRLEGFDFRQNPITGFENVDQKLLSIRNQLRTLSPLISTSDIEDVLSVLVVLGSLAARALLDAIFKDVTAEAAFQAEVRNELRRSPNIAAALEEHPHAAGGITDLSFRGTRIELKVERTGPVTLSTCERFLAQIASYVIATGKRVGILSVLDISPKTSYPMPAEEGIGVLVVPTDRGQVHIVTVVIQGNLERPSRL
jgi:hypothetical protein